MAAAACSGKPARPARALVALAGLLLPFLLMTMDVHWTLSVPVGFSESRRRGFWACSISRERSTTHRTAGAPRRTRRAARRARGQHARARACRAARRRRALAVAALSAAILVSAALLWVIVAGFRVLARLGARTSSVRSCGAGASGSFACSVVLYVPLLGSYSLSDPWETHYGEVAREMLSRDDWISTLVGAGRLVLVEAGPRFLAAGAVVLAVRRALSAGPDARRRAGAGSVPRPEWAARLPIVASRPARGRTRSIARSRSASAGAPAFSAALVLVEVPYWYLLAHQSMTDMPYVAPLTARSRSCCSVSAPIRKRSVRTVGARIVRGRMFGLSALHLLFGARARSSCSRRSSTSLSRHLTLQLSGGAVGFRLHLDEFISGSAGNCGLPGQRSVPAGGARRCRASARTRCADLGALPRRCFVGRTAANGASAPVFSRRVVRSRRSRRSPRARPGLVLPLVTVLVAVGAARAGATSAARARRARAPRSRASACPGTCRCARATARRSAIA